MSALVSSEANHRLDVWTVYDSPADYPGEIVARRFEVRAGASAPTADILLAPTVDIMRLRLERRGLVNLGRQPGDEPHIVEAWG